MPSKSRNGWNSVISSPASRTIRPISRGEASKVRKSFSKISTPSKPAAEIASSFSPRSPLIDTVAIEVFIRLASLRGASAASGRGSWPASGSAARKRR